MQIRIFPWLFGLGSVGLAAAFGVHLTAQGPVPSSRLTATPPKISSPQPAANTSDVSARYVRILCHMGTYDTYNNITETEVWGH